MHCAVVLVLLSLVIEIGYGILTETQIKSTAKLMRNVCQPKTKATDEQIDGMHNGIWNYEKAVGCYMYCCLKMMKVVESNGKFNVEEAKKQIPSLPVPRQAPTLAALENCDRTIDQTQIDDKCLLAFEVGKCVYMNNPSNYFLP